MAWSRDGKYIAVGSSVGGAGTMGSGRTSIEDKVATVIHEHNVESFDVDHTARMLREYAAFTSDLGWK